MSQIDLMPTALGLLNFKYRSKFFGENIFNPTYTPRAFIATYQDLGYIKDNYLTIISPVKRVKQFVLKPKSNSNYEIHFDELANTKINKKLEFETIAFYEEAALLLKNHKYQAIHGTK